MELDIIKEYTYSFQEYPEEYVSDGGQFIIDQVNSTVDVSLIVFSVGVFLFLFSFYIIWRK